MSYACTTGDAEIHEDAVAPYALRFTVTSSDPTNFDLSTVTAGEIKVKRGDGSEDTWACSITDQSSTALTLVHVFVTDDVPDPDLLVLQPYLTAPTGTFVANTQTLAVRPAYS